MRLQRRLRCSFCRKDENHVAKLVAGPRVYICDGCVALASRMMDGSSPDPSPPPAAAETSRWRKLLTLGRRVVRGLDARGKTLAHAVTSPDAS